MTIAGMGDVDGDGRGDLVIGAPGDRVAGGSSMNARNGRAYVFSGASGVLLHIFAPSEVGTTGFGKHVATVPDATGDNRPDILVSAPNGGSEGFVGGGGGRVYVFNGVTGARVEVLLSPRAELGGRFGGAVAGLRMPDRDKFLIGAEWEDPGYAPRNSGRAYIQQVSPFAGFPISPVVPH
jgi:hypothetical protein